MLKGLKEDEHSKVLWEKTLADAKKGRMSTPVPLHDDDVENFVLSPRFCIAQGCALWRGVPLHAPRLLILHVRCGRRRPAEVQSCRRLHAVGRQCPDGTDGKVELRYAGCFLRNPAHHGSISRSQGVRLSAACGGIWLASAPCLCQELLSLFKTDVNAAFRGVPVKELDRKYGHVVFMYEARVTPFAQLCAIVRAVWFARE